MTNSFFSVKHAYKIYLDAIYHFFFSSKLLKPIVIIIFWQVAFRAMQLEHENAILTSENLTLREEIYTLKQLLLHLKKTADNLT